MIGLLGSLMFVLSNAFSLKAAERLEVQFEDMSIPISIKELVEWGNKRKSYSSELSSWLNLLDQNSQEGLMKLLKAPLLKDRSMARQMLRSWVGRQLLDEVSDLFRVDEDRSGKKVFATLEFLLESQPHVDTLDLLESLPGEVIQLDLDGLLRLASQWRDELKNQQNLLVKLGESSSKPYITSNSSKVYVDFQQPILTKKIIRVPHRAVPIVIEVWTPSELAPGRKSLIVFMPGLGGSQDHFHWLAKSLSREGWPVVLLEHPGSDAKAVQALLEGKRSVPGAEVLPDRLADLNFVLEYYEQGKLGINGEKLVLMGHSLGALTALFASGLDIEPGLIARCQKALSGLSLTNLSQLLQCQLVDVSIPSQKKIPNLRAVVAINSFGSLLWPSNGYSSISVPVMFAGGTLDLITPPLKEQLGLLLNTATHPFSRALLVEGASHFSPVRVEGQVKQGSGDDLFQLGEALVGARPLSVQRVFAKEIIIFLRNLEAGKALPKSFHKKDSSLKFHLLNRSSIGRLLSN